MEIQYPSKLKPANERFLIDIIQKYNGLIPLSDNADLLLFLIWEHARYIPELPARPSHFSTLDS